MAKRGLTDLSSPWTRQQLSNKQRTDRLAWDIEEVRYIIEKANTDLLRHLAYFGPLTGMRASDVARLRLEDCTGGFMHVRKGKTKAAERRVPVHSKLRALVEQRLRESSEFVFPGLHGLGKNLSKQFTRFLDDIFPDRREVGQQADKTFHSYRHFGTHQMIRTGVAPHVVKQIVGHSQGKRLDPRDLLPRCNGRAAPAGNRDHPALTQRGKCFGRPPTGRGQTPRVEAWRGEVQQHPHFSP